MVRCRARLSRGLDLVAGRSAMARSEGGGLRHSGRGGSSVSRLRHNGGCSPSLNIGRPRFRRLMGLFIIYPSIVGVGE